MRQSESSIGPGRLRRGLCYNIALAKTVTGGVGVATENQRVAKRKYDDKTTQLIFRLRNDKDAVIIARFKSMPNKTEYLRGLVMNDIREPSGGDAKASLT